MRTDKRISLVVLLTSFVAGHTLCSSVSIDFAHAGDVQTEGIDRSAFSVVSSSAEVNRLLKAATSQQAAALERLGSWRGKGTLEAWFVVRRLPPSAVAAGGDALDEGDNAGRGFKEMAGPFEVYRTSNLSFLWSGPLRSLRSSVASLPPTTYTAIGDHNTRHELNEELIINCLVRPDGFYRMFPKHLYGEFDGLPMSLFGGQPTRVVERMTADVAVQVRESDLFDPTCMFEIGGSRVDQLCESYLRTVASRELAGRLTLKRRSDGTLLAAMQYVNSIDGDGAEPSLTVEVVLDASTAFLPREAVFINRERGVSESLAWDYSNAPEAVVPTRFERVKFDKTGARVHKRSVNITEFEVNGDVLDSEFDLSSIGVRDGDRLVDRVENDLSFIKGGVPVSVREESTSDSLRKWLICVNVAAMLFLVLAFAVRARRRGHGPASQGS